MASSSQDYYIGVDVGTGSARACIIDATGEIKALASKPIKMWQPQAGYYEQSTTDIWNSICECVRQVVRESKAEPSAVKGIGFDATCSLAVLSHDTDAPVPVTGPDFKNDGNDRNVVLWLDHRPEAETAQINATGHNLLRYVGGTMNIEMEIPKVLWLKNNMPPELFAKCKFYDLVDALTHLATSRETRSLCSAVCKQGYVPVGFDGAVKGWQDDFYHAIGLDDLIQEDYLRIGGVDKVNGNYLSAGEVVGNLGEKAARELGLPTSVKVGSGVIDAYAGWIGTVGAKIQLPPSNLDAGSSHAANHVSQAFTRLAAVAGTSTCHLVMSRDAIFAPGLWGPYRDVVLPGFWMAEGGQSATGELLRHVLQTHPAHSIVVGLAHEAGLNIYDFLNKHLGSMAESRGAPFLGHVARHLFLYGDLWGNRSPIADPDMKGAIVGLDSDTGVDGLALSYYATMEFIALQTRQIVEALNSSGHAISAIFMSGSQCMNPILMDLLATACGMPVVVPEYVAAAVVHGAALLGARAGGHGEGLWEIMDRMSRPGRVIVPATDARPRALLQAKYEVFLDLCESQRTYRAKVDEALKKAEAA